MAPLKLQYLVVRGLGEYIRTLLTDNQIDFIDERITFEEWKELKETMPLGQVPVLTDGERKIPQSGAILRYLARKYDLYGSSEDDKIFLDVLHEALKDLRYKFAMQVVFGDYENKKNEFDRDIYPAELGKIERLFKEHQNGRGFVLGDKVEYTSKAKDSQVSFVDYILFEELELALTSNPNNLDKVPLLKGFHERFQKRSNLQEYFAQRAVENPKFHGNLKI